MSSLQQTKFDIRARTSQSPEGSGTSRSEPKVATNLSPHLINANAGTISGAQLSIALIGPNRRHRELVAQALSGCTGYEVSEFLSYPVRLDEASEMMDQKFGVVIIDLDDDPEFALQLVESISADGFATVMVYSENADPELLVRCMRAGAREFLTLPLEQAVVEEALLRAAGRQPVVRTAKKATGKLFAFVGSKGGAGATTVACNFAVALAKESQQKTLLIDLDLPLGDAALNLGITAEFSAVDALEAMDRLDAQFLSQLLVKHSSGLWLLAAPGKFKPYQPAYEAVDLLLNVARYEFENVVVDLGSQMEMMQTAAYREATTVYLVTQSGIPELRNSNRLIHEFFSAAVPKLEIVLNRFESRGQSVPEEHITKALTRPAQWKIPNDYAAVRNMQISATPLVLTDSPISRQIRKMVSAVTGKSESADKNKKKIFSLSFFG
jgi:pilus assembly protein CpaE